MKIIKEGLLPSMKIAKMTCRSCGCVFEATKEEFTCQPDRDGAFWKIDCPTDDCNNTLFKYDWEQE